ncbi:unnamed protein product [Owenia fusiformis]|uniref:TNFR-Cys domain-containing protein n=1 Tax=Owenia fusiformis TaxID=6347 RepID=A0A8S4NCQ6_OWEFU|nr:unnamed protein product [Owenia fusiformis]
MEMLKLCMLGALLVPILNVKTCDAKTCEGDFNDRTLTKEQCRQCDNRRWISSKSSCQKCTECHPGDGLSQACGNGEGNDILISCIPCNHTNHWYSDALDSNQCKKSPQCHTFNRVYNKTATPTSSAICGGCLKGFFIPSFMNFLPGKLRPCDECALARSREDMKVCGLSTKVDESAETTSDDKTRFFEVFISVGAVFVIAIAIATVFWYVRNRPSCKTYRSNDTLYEVVPSKDLHNNNLQIGNITTIEIEQFPNKPESSKERDWNVGFNNHADRDQILHANTSGCVHDVRQQSHDDTWSGIDCISI